MLAEDPRIAALPDIHGHAKGEHKLFAEERPIPYTARMLFLWFFHACRRGAPRFLMVADHMNYLTFEDPAAVNLVRRALKLAQAGDLYGAAETAGVELQHAAVVSEGLRKGMRYSIGAEIDNDPRCRPDAQNIVDAMRPDGMIRSVHFLPIAHPQHGENWMWPFDNPEFVEFYESVGTERVWELYMATLLDAIEKLPGHIVGHFYVPAKFGHWPAPEVLEAYEDRFVDACASRGMAIEINSRYAYNYAEDDAAQRDAYRTAYVRLLRKAKEKNVAIAVGSDAHSPKDQGKGFDAVLAMLDEAGINEIAFPLAGRLARVALRATEEILRQHAAALAPKAPPAPAAGTGDFGDDPDDDDETGEAPAPAEAPAVNAAPVPAAVATAPSESLAVADVPARKRPPAKRAAPAEAAGSPAVPSPDAHDRDDAVSASVGADAASVAAANPAAPAVDEPAVPAAIATREAEADKEAEPDAEPRSETPEHSPAAAVIAAASAAAAAGLATVAGVVARVRGGGNGSGTSSGRKHAKTATPSDPTPAGADASHGEAPGDEAHGSTGDPDAPAPAGRDVPQTALADHSEAAPASSEPQAAAKRSRPAAKAPASPSKPDAKIAATKPAAEKPAPGKAAPPKAAPAKAAPAKAAPAKAVSAKAVSGKASGKTAVTKTSPAKTGAKADPGKRAATAGSKRSTKPAAKKAASRSGSATARAKAPAKATASRKAAAPARKTIAASRTAKATARTKPVAKKTTATKKSAAKIVAKRPALKKPAAKKAATKKSKRR